MGEDLHNGILSTCAFTAYLFLLMVPDISQA